MKILLSAYACEPNRGSEPGVGWNAALALAEHHDVHVVTQLKNRAGIEAFLTHTPVPTLRVTYFDLPAWIRIFRRHHIAFNLHSYYYLWQLGVFFYARQLVQKETFDIVHHVTWVKYAAPSLLSLLPLPSVWGPVGGGESTPAGFSEAFGRRGQGFDWTRRTVRRITRFDPLIKLGARSSSAALATTEQTAREMRRLGAAQVEVCGAVALTQQQIDLLSALPKPPDGPLRFVSIGRLLAWKGFHLGLQAFAQADIPGASYWIIGDGQDRARLEALAHTLGIRDRVRFLGSLSHQETLAQFAQCHVLVHPSLHDSGGAVCLEAMAAGKPVICLDLGGPGLHVTPDVGIAVTAHDPQKAVTTLAQSMQLMTDSARRRRLGQSGKERVRSYTWESKAQAYTTVYERVCARHENARTSLEQAAQISEVTDR